MPELLSTVVAGKVLTSAVLTLAMLVAPALFEFLTEPGLAAWPAASYLVDGLLQAGSFAVLFGAPGGGKTFLALAVALSVATGTAFLGRTVEHVGVVAYIIAEGAPGNFAVRVAAWKQAHGYAGTVDVHFLPCAVPLTHPASLAKLIAALKALPAAPVLIVIDTLARCFDGDENSSKDMGRLVAAVDRLRHETGAAVLLVHHSGWEGKHERGSNALRGAADTVLYLCKAKKPGTLLLEVVKQKDDEAAALTPLALDVVTLPEGATSRAIRPADAPPGDQLPEKHALALKLLTVSGALSYSEWKKQLACAGLSKATFDRIRVELVAWGFVQTPEGKNGKYIAAQGEADAK